MGTSCLRRSIMICRSRDCYEAYSGELGRRGSGAPEAELAFCVCFLVEVLTSLRTFAWTSLLKCIISGAWSLGFSALRPTDHFGFSKS